MKTTNKFSTYSILASEKQIGDKKRDTMTVYTMVLRTSSYLPEHGDVKRFLAEYNRMTKEVTFRNEKGQLIVVQKMGPSVVRDYVYAMAGQVFNAIA